MARDDIEAIRREPELSPEMKEAIARIAELGGVWQGSLKDTLDKQIDLNEHHQERSPDESAAVLRRVLLNLDPNPYHVHIGNASSGLALHPRRLAELLVEDIVKVQAEKHSPEELQKALTALLKNQALTGDDVKKLLADLKLSGQEMKDSHKFDGNPLTTADEGLYQRGERLLYDTATTLFHKIEAAVDMDIGAHLKAPHTPGTGQSAGNTSPPAPRK